jgi:hypothetical protein
MSANRLSFYVLFFGEITVLSGVKASNMARNPRQASLYELINKARFKNAQQKALARIGVKQEPVKQDEPVSQVQQVQTETAKTDIVKTARPEPVWTGRPKPVRFYPDRIELCLSWQVAGLSLLALAAILLVFFRLGQIYSNNAEVKKVPQATVAVEKIMPPRTIETAPKPAVESKPPKMVELMGENVIVITSYAIASHLEPVKQYFAQYGIATEIIKRGPRYLLVTQDRFNNVEKPGTDGYEMKKKIMSVGANYKPSAGSGFESFGTKPFQDVYGMKVNAQ